MKTDWKIAFYSSFYSLLIAFAFHYVSSFPPAIILLLQQSFYWLTTISLWLSAIYNKKGVVA